MLKIRSIDRGKVHRVYKIENNLFYKKTNN
jgi:hypothetical protein